LNGAGFFQTLFLLYLGFFSKDFRAFFDDLVVFSGFGGFFKGFGGL